MGHHVIRETAGVCSGNKRLLLERGRVVRDEIGKRSGPGVGRLRGHLRTLDLILEVSGPLVVFKIKPHVLNLAAGLAVESRGIKDQVRGPMAWS